METGYMRRAMAAETRIIHTMPGRVRIHLPGWTEPGDVERRVRQIPGVCATQANSLTGNILIRFDPARTDERTVVRAAAMLATPGGAVIGAGQVRLAEHEEAQQGILARRAGNRRAVPARFVARRTERRSVGNGQPGHAGSPLVRAQALVSQSWHVNTAGLALKAAGVIIGVARASSPLGLALVGIDVALLIGEARGRRTVQSAPAPRALAGVCARCGAAR
jgi:hypothetical protein